MIRHQTVAKDSYTSVVEVLLHQPQIGEAVLILRESFTPVYAPLCNVAGHVRQDTSVSTRHAQGLYKKNRSVQAVPFSLKFVRQSTCYFATMIAIVVDVPDIAVVTARCAVAQVEVIADGKDGLAGRIRRHIDTDGENPRPVFFWNWATCAQTKIVLLQDEACAVARSQR